MLCLKKVLRPKGFTLIEVTCVLFLCMFFAGLCYLQVQYLPSWQAHREACLIRSTIMMMRTHALATGTVSTIVFDEHGYTAHEKYTLPRGIVWTMSPHGPPSSRHHLSRNWCTYKHRTLRCYPDGALTAGAVYLAPAHGRVVYAVTTDASAISAVRIYCYRSSWELVT